MPSAWPCTVGGRQPGESKGLGYCTTGTPLGPCRSHPTKATPLQISEPWQDIIATKTCNKSKARTLRCRSLEACSVAICHRYNELHKTPALAQPTSLSLSE
jgi:hypothetical protein